MFKNLIFYLFLSTTTFIYIKLLFASMKIIVIQDKNDIPREPKTVEHDVSHYNDRVNRFLNIGFAKRSRRE